jgi:hypothetical protein
MNLTNPDALLWAVLAVPVALLFLLKVRVRRVPVSTGMFWRRIFEQKQSRSLWRSLRHLLSLLAQLFFLGLLVAALAAPVPHGEAQRARRLVLVLDNSASMTATDVAPSRLDRAKEEARRIVAGLRSQDELAVVAGGMPPQVVCGFTSHRGTLRKAVDGVPATHGPTRVREAVELARRLVADHENGRIVVLSDGGFAGAEELARAEDVRWIVVGQRSGNVGITAFQARRNLSDPAGYEVFVEVAHHADGEERAEGRLVVELNGNEVDVIPLNLAPNETWRHVIQNTSVPGGHLRARVEYEDALAADNEAWAVLPPLEARAVHLMTPANLYLEKVFEANPLVKLTAGDKAPAPADAVRVFYRKVPGKLPAGPLLVIDPEVGCDLWQLDKPLVNPIVTLQDRESPLMANVKLDQFFLSQARRLVFSDKVKPLVRPLATAETGDPVYCAIERPEGRVLVLALSLEEGNLPLRVAFPILVANALNGFSRQREELREAQRTGAVLEVELPGDEPFVLQAPDGTSRPLRAERGRAILGPFDRCGVWRVVGEDADAALVEIACNLADSRESDLRPPSGAESNRADLPAGGLLQHPVWYYLLAVAGLFTVMEWYLYQRRVLR